MNTRRQYNTLEELGLSFAIFIKIHHPLPDEQTRLTIHDDVFQKDFTLERVRDKVFVSFADSNSANSLTELGTFFTSFIINRHPLPEDAKRIIIHDDIFNKNFIIELVNNSPVVSFYRKNQH